MKKKKTLIIVVGKTSTGKDTVCNYLKQNYGIESICSFSTRPMRDYEENGVQHYFVTDQEMDQLETRKDLLAWTKFPKTGYRYCSTLDSFKDNDIVTYILNPDGVDYMMKNAKDLNLRIIIIYINLDEKTIRQRAKLRKDEESLIEARIASESEEFDKFYDSGVFDYEVDAGLCKLKVFAQIDRIMEANGIFKTRINLH